MVPGQALGSWTPDPPPQGPCVSPNRGGAWAIFRRNPKQILPSKLIPPKWVARPPPQVPLGGGGTPPLPLGLKEITVAGCLPPTPKSIHPCQLGFGFSSHERSVLLLAALDPVVAVHCPGGDPPSSRVLGGFRSPSARQHTTCWTSIASSQSTRRRSCTCVAPPLRGHPSTRERVQKMEEFPVWGLNRRLRHFSGGNYLNLGAGYLPPPLSNNRTCPSFPSQSDGYNHGSRSVGRIVII